MAQLGGGGGGGGQSLLDLPQWLPVCLLPLPPSGARGHAHLDLLRGAGVRLRLQAQVGHWPGPGEGAPRLGVLITTESNSQSLKVMTIESNYHYKSLSVMALPGCSG